MNSTVAAIDSTIILDILLDDQTHAKSSMCVLENYLIKGALIISPVAFSECSASLANASHF